ncbi:Hpt domain-containing protein [Asticcacaulis sp. BYS171W]|uniref:Hpt domain-containing protein n=1 Tax=Asticcacaulis aquaticus TaxID=2984212 RepID=A0ABT5HVE3_9CAUL|nr:Hpt domain-containing protein [Asticcacaulis aquaticus]MDC7683887.1 Hpt domain-containing protein [Asticcacaulis aquaticus]
MSEKAQIIQIPNTLRAKVGGKLGALDQAAIAKAEEALTSLSDQFEGWLEEEVTKLEAAQETIRRDGFTTHTAEALYFRCHDLKGLGTTYGYPLITRIAGSICKMLDDEEIRMLSPKLLIDAHIDAIRAVVRGRIKEDTHPVGKTLAETLEARVLEHLDKIKN